MGNEATSSIKSTVFITITFMFGQSKFTPQHHPQEIRRLAACGLSAAM
jgi:hypothetical protein